MRSQGSIYVVEDTHTMHHSGLVRNPSEYWMLFGEAFWSLHALYVGKSNRYGPGNATHPIFEAKLRGLHGYPTIMFLERGSTMPKFHEVVRGTDRLADLSNTWRYSRGIERA